MSAGRRLALVVANDQYADPGLRRLVAPAQDAAALAEALGDPTIGGFDVQVLRNETAQGMRLAVEDFFADRAAEDLLLLHFSCHGVKNAAGELFLAAADTRPTRLASTAMAADFVNRQMADSRAQRIALFLDCCYGGAFPRGMVVRATGEAQVLDAFAGQKQVGGGRGRVVITASSAMEYAFEGDHLATGARPGPSVFTSAVVEGLVSGEADRDGDGWVGLTELVGFVTERVQQVTPNQNPQMWTFGAQGELLIARSKIRRITPTPLAPELVEAMDSPLAATRFGVVDDLHDRLRDSDLGQAFAAWLALHKMVDDDSRKVSDAARQSIAEAVPRAASEVIDLRVDTRGRAVGEVRLDGPPIALTAVATAREAWLHVEQVGPVVRITADRPGDGASEGALLLAGPTGESVLSVRIQDRSTGPAPPREPVPSPRPEPQTPVPPAPQFGDVAERTPRPGPPWWAIAAIGAGAVVLVLLNQPGPHESKLAWYDDATGWLLYRSWTDAAIIAPLVIGLGALLAAVLRTARWQPRWSRLAFAVVAGCATSLVADSLSVLLAGTAVDRPARIATAVVAAAILAVVGLVAGPFPRPWPVAWLPATGVLAGAVVAFLSQDVKHPDGVSYLDVTGWGILTPISLAALGWAALATQNSLRARPVLVSAALVNLAFGVLGVVPAWTKGDSAKEFLVAMVGYVLVAAAIIGGTLVRPAWAPHTPEKLPG
jgi:uncharacterized caspase-like protein